MSAKRGQAVQRPTGKGEWQLRHGSKATGKAWSELSNTRLVTPLARLYDQLVSDPRWRGDPERHHQLKGGLATAKHQGRTLERWQHEISGSGRVWFLMDDDQHIVWLVYVGAGHPPQTG